MAEIPQELFHKIRRIQYQSMRLANDLFAGAYKSAFRGKGMEFEEVREYLPGDEYRSIDWNVTARMNRPFVKNFREERNLTVILAVDLSASTLFGTGNVSKREMIAEIAAVIAFSAIKNNDRVGLLLFSSEVEKYFPPAKGTRHVLRVIRELLVHQPLHSGTDIGAALSFLGRVQGRSCICFLISDFLSGDFFRAASLIAAKHDLIGLSVSDPFEREMPQLGFASLYDLETKEAKLLDTSSKPLRDQFKAEAQESTAARKKLMQKIGADLVEISTHAPYLPQLRKFFALRKMRHRWGQ